MFNAYIFPSQTYSYQTMFANIKLCLYFQVENAEGGEKLIDLSDAIVACGYTGPINVDQKKAITE